MRTSQRQTGGLHLLCQWSAHNRIGRPCNIREPCLGQQVEGLGVPLEEVQLKHRLGPGQLELLQLGVQACAGGPEVWDACQTAMSPSPLPWLCT